MTFPLNVKGTTPRGQVVLGAGKKQLVGVAAIDLEAYEITPTLANQISYLLNKGKLAVKTSDGKSLNKTTFEALIGGRNATLGTGSFAPLSQAASMRNRVLWGMRLIAPTTPPADSDALIGTYTINLEIGQAIVAGWTFGPIPVASANIKADVKIGHNGVNATGFKKDGTTVAAKLSAASKGFYVHVLMAVCSDGTPMGADTDTALPLFIFGDEAVAAAEVALTETELDTAVAGRAGTLGKAVGGWIEIGRFRIQSAANKAISATYAPAAGGASTITDVRPQLV
jgi:hypothetical protein